jgi:hypothetical protein
MSGNADNDVQRFKVSFDSGFQNTKLVPFDAYVEYGDERHVFRCTSAINGTLLVYVSYAVAAFTGKGRKSAFDILSEVSLEYPMFRHMGVELDMITQEVVYVIFHSSYVTAS